MELTLAIPPHPIDDMGTFVSGATIYGCEFKRPDMRGEALVMFVPVTEEMMGDAGFLDLLKWQAAGFIECWERKERRSFERARIIYGTPDNMKAYRADYEALK